MSIEEPVLMVLGGAEKSRPLLLYARQRGYCVVLCDRSESNPCRSLCTNFELVSTTDFDGLLEVARRYAINGVVSFGSDVMALVAARLARELELPGNPPEAVETLIKKDRFRQFLVANGFNAPRSQGAASLPDRAWLEERLTLPVIVKPVDGAGSTAVSRVADWGTLEQSFQKAKDASRDGRVIIEEYLDRDHPFMIGGDVFVQDGQVIFWGLLNSHRSNPDRPFLPTGTSYPAELTPEREEQVRSTIERLVSLLELSYGGFNVEIMFANDLPYLIEFAPRNGGNRIPELLQKATGFDLVAALVEASLSNGSACVTPLPSRWNANYMIQAPANGIFQELILSEDLEPYLTEMVMDVTEGEEVNAFEKAPDSLGAIFLEFKCYEQMTEILNRLPELVDVRISAR